MEGAPKSRRTGSESVGNTLAVQNRRRDATMSMTSYLVEYAKSNRAGCKVCKGKIDKDELRIGTEAPGHAFGNKNCDALGHAPPLTLGGAQARATT